MMECKKALSESNGDIDKAIEWLRKKRGDAETNRLLAENPRRILQGELPD